MSITITDQAMINIKRLQAEYGDYDSGLRFGYSSGGCSGNKYIIEFDDKDNNDLVFTKVYKEFKINIYISEDHITKLVNSTIDWKESLMESGFEIDNPQAKQPCGCGESINFS